MADDVWSALTKGCLAFSHTYAGKLTVTAFKDTGSLVASLWDNSPPGTAKTRLGDLKDAIENAAEAAKPVAKAVEPEAKKAKEAVAAMATELATSPFTSEAAGRAATELAYVLIALDASLDIIAKKIAEPETNPVTRQDLENQIRGIREPWVAPFRSMGAETTKGFDSLCKTVLGLDNAGRQFADRLAWSREHKRLALTLTAAGPFGLGPPAANGVTPLNLDGVSVEAFFDYKTVAKVGVALRSHLRAGLRRDKMLDKIIPEQAPTADASSIAIALDTKDGLTFGEGPNRKITLPVRFNFPGVELRELAIARPVGKDENSGRIDLMVTVAGKFGEILGVVAEGGGVIIRWKGEPNEAVEVLPKPPHGAGLRIKTGLVSGGGYLRYVEERSEYGGVLDLSFTKIGVWGAGVFSADPFSFVVAMGIRFLPKIELSFGFTLNGIGGILAIDRRLDSDALRKGMREGALNQILFPADPIAAAPKILDRLGAIFPAQAGGFVVGPLLELGWGSQSGFVRAKIGVILALPDPKVVVLGALNVAVPSPDVPPEARIVDLNLEIAAEFTADYLWIGGSLVNSKLAGVTVNGDLGLLVRWAGGAAFALSAGGFYSKFTPPPELADMRRLSVELSPPKVDWLKIRGEAFFAITANSVQFGGKLVVTADLGPVEGKAWLGVEALFLWSPRFYFIFAIDAGIEIKAFGETVAGVKFTGELSGTRPWRIEGHARTKILLWKVPVDIGPIEWGERDPSIADRVSPAHLAAEALAKPEAWTPRLPAGTDQLVRFTEVSGPPLLVHPLGALEVKQLRVPFEIDLDRVGGNPVSARRIHIVEPKLGSRDAAAVSHAVDFFAPGHFRNLTEDQQTSRTHFEEFPCGAKLAATRTVDHGAPIAVSYAWETVYPHETFERNDETWSFGRLVTVALSANAVSAAARHRTNPYVDDLPARAAPVTMAPVGEVEVRRRDDLSAVTGATGRMTTTAAASLLVAAGPKARDAWQMVSWIDQS